MQLAGAVYIHYELPAKPSYPSSGWDADDRDTVGLNRHVYFGPLLSDVKVESPSSYYFNLGFQFHWAWNTRITNCNLNGRSSYYSGSAIKFLSRSANSLIEGTAINNWNKGLELSDPHSVSEGRGHEGITLVDSTIDYVQYGVYYVPSSPYLYVGHLAVQGCTITTRTDGAIGIYARASWLSVFSENTISTGTNASAPYNYTIITGGVFNSITDITALSGLHKLQILDLKGTQIKNITPLSHLYSLITLDLSNNEIEDISPLSGLVNLRELELSYNNIKEFKWFTYI